MSREDLIEVLARSMLEMHRKPGDWNRALEEAKRHYREDAALVAPTVVAFVAAWLGDRYGERSAEDLVRLWREDMSA